MTDTSDLWGQKNETLSDKSAENEYGIPREEIYRAMQAGKLQFREGCMHGNTWYRLLRTEVERYIEKTYGSDYLREKKSQKELSNINQELRKLNKRISELEKRKKELLGP